VIGGNWLASIGDKLRLYASCQGVWVRMTEKNWSELRCCSGKGATIFSDLFSIF
jgi:hypothetical protein